MTAETTLPGTATHAPETATNAPTPQAGAVRATVTGSAAGGPTSAVWDALTGNPGATVTAIAAAAGVSKTAARKALTTLETDGRAARTPGGMDGGKRTPDTWHPAPPANTAETPADGGHVDTATAESTEPTRTDASDGLLDDATATVATATVATADAVAPETADGDTEAGSGTGDEAATTGPPPEGEPDHDTSQEAMEAAAVAEAERALGAVREAIEAALQALEAGDRSAVSAAAEAIYTGSGKARRVVRAAANGRPRVASGAPKSHPGELRAKVAAHLTAHPDLEFTPHEIGKAIGHSAGAVANALDRLVALGQAVETCERPRRFSTAPASTADTATGVVPQATQS